MNIQDIWQAMPHFTEHSHGKPPVRRMVRDAEDRQHCLMPHMNKPKDKPYGKQSRRNARR